MNFIVRGCVRHFGKICVAFLVVEALILFC